MSFAQHLAEDRRLVILRLLADQHGYALNESTLQTALEAFAHAVSRDTVRADAAWLEEVGLVTTELVAGKTLVVTITTRGVDVARGRSIVPGVKRPSPGA